MMTPWMTSAEIAEQSANRPLGRPTKGRLVALGRPDEIAMLYVIKFTHNVVKIGVTVDFATRLTSHRRSVCPPRGKLEHVAHFVTHPFRGARVAERRLVEAARALGKNAGYGHASEWVRIRDVTPLLVLAADLATEGL
jgi:hypothetical protein